MEGFDLEAFCAWVEASGRERSALRQDLVRGLKDYYLHLYGYDRYGAETAFMVPERMRIPHVYGFGVLRILSDRRITMRCKIRVAERALAVTEYGQDRGTPQGLYVALLFLAQHAALGTRDLRYALTVTCYDHRPFAGMDRRGMSAFLHILMSNEEIPPAERAFWVHSLLARHPDETGGDALVNTALGCTALPAEMRRELAWAWVRQRQPRLEVPIPAGRDDIRSVFVEEHLPFWVAHMPSRSTSRMMRLGLRWLARLGESVEALAEEFLEPSGPYAEGLQSAVADILAEHGEDMPAGRVKMLVERGLAKAVSAPVRRKFYSVGSALIGDEYLQRASADPAGSVRQWASRTLQRAATR